MALVQAEVVVEYERKVVVELVPAVVEPRQKSIVSLRYITIVITTMSSYTSLMITGPGAGGAGGL